MEEEIKKYQQEKQQLIQQLNSLEQKKAEISLRIAEVQGIIKYLQEKEVKKNGK